MTTALISHPECALHDVGSWHPESPARLAAVEDQLIASGVAGLVLREEAPSATREQLERVHTPAYLDSLEGAVPASGVQHLDPDTALCPATLTAARRAAGAVVRAVDLVCGGRAENAFCAVRPPGHHAERDRAMGFCFYNNLAIGVAHAMAVYGVQRVAVADFDVHHGNGTETIFQDDPRVLMVSTFQHPFYPYSGTEGRSARMVNVPLAAYSPPQAFRAAVEEAWLPALEAFRPEMIFVSAGFDAHREDDMAMLNLTEADYAWVTAQLKAVAARHARGRIVSVLEGGYALSALGRSVVAHLKVLGDF